RRTTREILRLALRALGALADRTALRSRRNGHLRSLARVEAKRRQLDQAASVGELQRLPIGLQLWRDGEKLRNCRMSPEVAARRRRGRRFVTRAVSRPLVPRGRPIYRRDHFDPGAPA